MSEDRSTWPPMVRFGLMGVRSRGAAWAFFWISIVLAVACIAYAFFNSLFIAGIYIGGLFLLAALFYYLAIRWVDQHSKWG